MNRTPLMFTDRVFSYLSTIEPASTRRSIRSFTPCGPGLEAMMEEIVDLVHQMYVNRRTLSLRKLWRVHNMDKFWSILIHSNLFLFDHRAQRLVGVSEPYPSVGGFMCTVKGLVVDILFEVRDRGLDNDVISHMGGKFAAEVAQESTAYLTQLWTDMYTPRARSSEFPDQEIVPAAVSELVTEAKTILSKMCADVVRITDRGFNHRGVYREHGLKTDGTFVDLTGGTWEFTDETMSWHKTAQGPNVGVGECRGMQGQTGYDSLGPDLDYVQSAPYRRGEDEDKEQTIRNVLCTIITAFTEAEDLIARAEKIELDRLTSGHMRV